MRGTTKRNLWRGALTALFTVAAPNSCGVWEQKTVQTEQISYTKFLEHIESGNIRKVEISQKGGFETIKGEGDSTDEKTSAPLKTIFMSGVPANENIYARVEKHGVEVTVNEASPGSPLTLFIILATLGAALSSPLWWPRLSMRIKGRRNSRDKTVTLDDVAGIDEALEDIQDIIDYLKDPSSFKDKGLKVPRGALLCGPPGNGKTLLAKALAGEAGVNFLSYSGADFKSSPYMGIATGKVKGAFATARSMSPCILFIDEFDSIGRTRSGDRGIDSGALQDSDNTLNQLLVELDGFDKDTADIVLIAATNRPESLDPAILRPGRIDRQITVNKPDIAGRQKILEIYLRKLTIPVGDDVTSRRLAKATYNFSGAELSNLVNEAGLLANKESAARIEWEHFERALDKIMLGSTYKSRKFSEEERNTTAYHEAGHALLAHLLPTSFPIYKASIVPRGKTLGVVMRAPDSDTSSQTFEFLKGELAITLAGRAAEELVFGTDKTTSGAQGDLKQVDAIARAMVLQSGMAQDLSLDYVDEKNIHLLSEETKADLDKKVEALKAEGLQEAKKLIGENWESFLKLADALLENETLDGAEIEALLGSKAVRVPAVPDRTPPDERTPAPA